MRGRKTRIVGREPQTRPTAGSTKDQVAPGAPVSEVLLASSIRFYKYWVRSAEGEGGHTGRVRFVKGREEDRPYDPCHADTEESSCQRHMIPTIKE